MPDETLEDHNKLQQQDQVLANEESATQDIPLTADEQATEEMLNKPLVDEVSEDVAEEVGDFFEQSKEQNEVSHEDSQKPYISFEHVFKSFGDFKVLEDVSFFVKPGETLCILGRSGVGKSVSLQMLMGFLKPDKGKVCVANEDICAFNEKEMQPIRRKVTMVFQNGALFDSISVGENVAFPLREKGELEEEQIRQVVKGLLEMVGVAGMDDLLPSDLSTGMKRSVAIARALAARAGGCAVRRADDDGGSVDGAPAGRPD